MNKEINITLTRQPSEHVILHGNAAKVIEPQKVELFGTIGAPANFVRNRKPDQTKCHAIFSKTGRTIQLVCDENSPLGTVVTGKMVLHEFLQKLRINHPQPYLRAELEEVFKFVSRFFKDKSSHRDLMLKLKNFNDRIFIENEQHKDGAAGIKKTSSNNRIESELQGYQICLVLPLFEGLEDSVLILDFEIETRNEKGVFFLICQELPAMIDNEIYESFKGERADLEAEGIYCIDEF